MHPPEPAIVVDARGRPCPIPVVEAAKALAGLPAGALIAVRASDPAAPADLRAFCELAGHTLVSLDAGGDGCTALVRKVG